MEILNGTDVPKEIRLLPYVVSEERLDKVIETTDKGGVATIVYPQKWVQEMIANVKAGKEPPADPEL